MPGFLVGNVKINTQLQNRFPDRCIYEDFISGEECTVKRNTLNKFMQDKAYQETENLVLVSEGCIFNKTALFAKYNVSTVAELMAVMYRQEGETFFSAFRGPFSGALYDKKEDKWLVYTNHIGDNPVFYTLFDGGFAAGSEVNYLTQARASLGETRTLDESAVYQMLTFAFMADDSTFAQEVKRLRGGMYLCCRNGSVQIKEYFTFSKHLDRFRGQSEEQVINQLDVAFRKAVELEYAKDEEYGLDHLADLSGGLDSRMNMWVAHAMKPRHMTLLTYCQANYLDEIIAKEIAEYWRDELLVKPLNDASFMYDIDENTLLTCGLSLYSGISGGKRLLESVDMTRFGIEHTGMIGDAVLGSFFKKPEDMAQHRPTGRYSERLVSRLNEKVQNYYQNFEDYEIYLLYTRCFQGASNTHLLRRNYTEVASPFLNVEFLQMCMDIPYEMRRNHHIYKKWILAKYPEAAAFRWEKTSGKITDSALTTFVRNAFRYGPMLIKKALGIKKTGSQAMVPMGYWIQRDPHLRNYIRDYAQEGLAWLQGKCSECVVQDIKNLAFTGNGLEITMALTVLSAAKQHLS